MNKFSYPNPNTKRITHKNTDFYIMNYDGMSKIDIYCPENIAPPGRNYLYDRCKQSWFSVDVYGERDGEIIMYEVGHCERNKLDWLRKYVGKVIHMPFLSQWMPGFYRKPEKKCGLTEEERWFVT